MCFPQSFGPGAVPASVRILIAKLLPQLLEGEHPALVALQTQLRQASITRVEMTGSGFYVDFTIPTNLPLTVPADFEGGDAEIYLNGAEHTAGCVVFVRGGRLSMFEAYTYADDWPLDAEVVDIKNVFPLLPR